MESSIISAREFLEVRLSSLLKGKELVDVLVIMGEAGPSCRRGEIRVEKRGLRIYSQLEIIGVSRGCPFASAFEAPTATHRGVIVIAFTGIQDLDRLAMFMVELHQKNKEVQIVLATCYCGKGGSSKRIMLPLLVNNVVVAAVETHDCTGASFISDAVTGLIATWQPPAPRPIPR